jgi:hypothetical protein
MRSNAISNGVSRLVVAVLAAGGAIGCAGSPDESPGVEAASLTAPMAQINGGMMANAAMLGRPDYVITPHGLVHKSCVYRVGDDATIDPQSHPACAYSRIDTRAPSVKPTINGWVEDGNAWLPNFAQDYEGNFHVPAEPAQGGAIIFFFNALEDNGGQNIIQPVLSHGCEYGNGCGWNIASWYGGSYWGGNYYHSAPINVRAGDTLYGRMYADKNNCAGGCLWTTYTQDTTTGAATQIHVHTTVAWFWAFGGVLEAYSVNNCAQFPGGHEYFWNLKALDWNGRNESPGSYSTWVGQSGCGENAVWSPPFVNLYY